MKRNIRLVIISILLLLVLLMLPIVEGQAADSLLQQPTGSIPTVTGTPRGEVIKVNTDQDQINVRSGPSMDYPRVGVLIAGQEIAAVGRSPGGDWIQIRYPGVEGGLAWVYSFLVSQPAVTLPIVEPPPTPTPQTTPTIDPTLVGQFNLIATPTRLPTFTAPAPIIYPTSAVDPGVFGGVTALPMGLVIVGLAVVGIFGILLSIVRGR